MTVFYQDPRMIIYNSDVLECLKKFGDESVQCVVTSPPYWGLRDYGVKGQLGLEETPEDYIEKIVVIFREIRRILKKGGTAWVNLGDSYTSGGRNSRDAGKSKNHRPFEGWGDRAKTPINLKPKDLIGIPWRVAFALQADGWWLRCDIIWHKPNPMPESVIDRPTRAHEYLFMLTKSAKYYYDYNAIKEPAITKSPKTWPAGWATGDTPHNSVSHNIKDVRAKNKTLQKMDSEDTEPDGFRNKRTVWTVNPAIFSEAHFATFPPKLIEPCILAGTKAGDTVLDPFWGSGTTGEVCLKHSRKVIGIELKLEYCELSMKRFKQGHIVFSH